MVVVRTVQPQSIRRRQVENIEREREGASNDRRQGAKSVEGQLGSKEY